jgi:hypothetical protein
MTNIRSISGEDDGKVTRGLLLFTIPTVIKDGLLLPDLLNQRSHFL